MIPSRKMKAPVNRNVRSDETPAIRTLVAIPRESTMGPPTVMTRPSKIFARASSKVSSNDSGRVREGNRSDRFRNASLGNLARNQKARDYSFLARAPFTQFSGASK